ncbi:hypothetical protein K737_300791 [Holospora undulata HU1]|uniref:Uncharacterized protein n=1 Tax=Holospora undulata HU1 TaxID=1321371 RepID=A0A061JHJ0_9PROT|nr:hypothetical protein K737_300791 [Holospora undulata HU1]
MSASALINENDGAPFLLMLLESFGKRRLAFRSLPWDDAGFFYTSRRGVPELRDPMRGLLLAFPHVLRRKRLPRPFSIPSMSMLFADLFLCIEGQFSSTAL